MTELEATISMLALMSLCISLACLVFGDEFTDKVFKYTTSFTILLLVFLILSFISKIIYNL